MSGIMMMLIGVGGGSGVVSPLPISSVGDSELAPTNPSAQIGFNSDGVLSGVGNGTVNGPNWYTPTTTGIGASYWCKLTLNSGTAPNTGSAVGSVISIGGGTNWAWSRSTNGTTTANCTLSVYADAGGAPQLSTVTFNVSVDRSI